MKNFIQKHQENIYSFGATVSRASSRFLLVFIASFLLTKSEFGIFNIFLSIYFFSRLFSENSLNLPFIKFASDGENDPARITFQIIFLKFLYSIIVSSVLLSCSGLIVEYTGLGRTSLLYLLPFTLLALTFYMFVGQVLTAQLKMRSLLMYEFLNGIIFVFCVLVLFFLVSDHSSEVLIATFTVSMFLSALLGCFIFRDNIQIAAGLRKTLLLKIVSYSKYTVLSGISSLVILRADVLMLGYFRTAVEVGIYGMALFVNEAVNLVFDSVLRLCLPKASSLSSEMRDGKIKMLFYQSVRNIYVGIIPIVIVIGVAAKATIHLIYQGKYDDSIYLVYVFLAISLTKPIGYVAGVILGATGYIKVDNRNCWIIAGLNIILNIVLIPRYGIYGAAVASGSSFLCLTALNFYSLRKIFK